MVDVTFGEIDDSVLKSVGESTKEHKGEIGVGTVIIVLGVAYILLKD